MTRVELPRRRRSVFPTALRGASIETIESRCLEGNAMGDPSTRAVGVYRPPSGRTDGRPLLLFLPGFAGEGSHLAARPGYLGENEFALFDRLVRSGVVGEAVVLAPDCLTTLGGSQYVNSRATGRYADFVVQELVPWAKETFRSGPVGVLGQSSGGFGALHLALEFPGVFDSVGVSAGDMAFDLCYWNDVPRAVRGFVRAGGPEAFLAELLERPGGFRGPSDPRAPGLNLLAMASCYSPREDGSGAFDLPFDPDTGEREEDVWARWLAFDPVLRLNSPAACDTLRGLRSLHLTAAREDEWVLDVAARRFVRRAKERSVPVHYEEFPGGHFDKLPRFEALFSGLVRSMTRESS